MHLHKHAGQRLGPSLEDRGGDVDLGEADYRTLSLSLYPV